MIYHRQLESSWIEEAKELEESLNVSIIGRARKQKIIASKEFVNETLRVDRDYLIDTMRVALLNQIHILIRR